MSQTKLMKNVNFLIKILIVILSFGFLAHRFIFRYDFNEVLANLEGLIFRPFFWIFFIVVLFLMPINMGFEAIKWKFVIKKLENISLFKALMAVFSGITIGSFTPNRSGENIGRIFILKNSNRWQALFSTFIASFSQLIITIVIGTLSLSGYFILNWNLLDSSRFYIVLLIWCVSVALSVLSLLVFFRLKIFKKLISVFIPQSKKDLKNNLEVLTLYSYLDLLKVLLFSLLRYIIFSTQFFLIMRLCGIEFFWAFGYMFISVMYLLSSVIPSITLTEFGIRGSVSIILAEFYFHLNTGMMSELTPKLLMASIIIWLVNLMLPAIIGQIFVYKLQFFRE